jgi:hypothetical protein
MKHAQPYASGYAAPVGELTAYAHADGSLSFEAPDGAAVDLTPEQTAQLADLLAMSGALRAASRRRRARALYQQRHEEA